MSIWVRNILFPKSILLLHMGPRALMGTEPGVGLDDNIKDTCTVPGELTHIFTPSHLHTFTPSTPVADTEEKLLVCEQLLLMVSKC